MKIFENPDGSLPRGGVVAIGMFDGVHLGHQEVIRRAVKLAEERRTFSSVLTFRNHPLSVIAPKKAPLRLASRAVRREAIASLGVTELIELDFTTDFSHLTREEFLHRLIDAAAPSAVVVGENFSFGAGGLGDPAYLREESSRLGFLAVIAPLAKVRDETVSSTRIRDFLAAGDLSRANEFLGRPFVVCGKVTSGDGRGRTLGFPTANVRLSPHLAMPQDGAYAVRVQVEGDTYGAIANIGENPTFGGAERRLEVHLLDFSGTLYEKTIRTSFIKRLRGERRFPSPAALVEQIKKDEEAARTVLAD